MAPTMPSPITTSYGLRSSGTLMRVRSCNAIPSAVVLMGRGCGFNPQLF